MGLQETHLLENSFQHWVPVSEGKQLASVPLLSSSASEAKEQDGCTLVQNVSQTPASRKPQPPKPRLANQVQNENTTIYFFNSNKSLFYV